jgi:hypothetical protein
VLALAIAGGAGMAVFRGVSGGVTRLIAVGTSAFLFRDKSWNSLISARKSKLPRIHSSDICPWPLPGCR